MTTDRNLLATIAALNAIGLSRWKPEPYPNRRGVWGMHFSFWHAGQYHNISVHDCMQYLQPRQLAHLISGIQAIDEPNWGVYANDKGVPGFYASAQGTIAFDGSDQHWYMIGRSAEKNCSRLLRQKRFLSDEEKDLLDYLERLEGSGRRIA